MKDHDEGYCKGDLMTNKHTPGPWEIEIRRDGYLKGYYEIKAPKLGKDCFLARTYQPSTEDSKTIAANARLIAAAPDLLRECKTALLRLDLVYSYFKEASKGQIGVLDSDFYLGEAEITHKIIDNLATAIAKAEAN